MLNENQQILPCCNSWQTPSLTAKCSVILKRGDCQLPWQVQIAVALKDCAQVAANTACDNVACLTGPITSSFMNAFISSGTYGFSVPRISSTEEYVLVSCS